MFRIFIFIFLLMISSIAFAECPDNYNEEILGGYVELLYGDPTLSYLLIDNESCEANLEYEVIENSSCFIFDLTTTGNLADVLAVEPGWGDCSCNDGYTYFPETSIDPPRCLRDDSNDPPEDVDYVVDLSVDLGFQQDARFYVTSCNYYNFTGQYDYPDVPSSILFYSFPDIREFFMGNAFYGSDRISCLFDPNYRYSVEELVSLSEIYIDKEFNTVFASKNGDDVYFDILGHGYEFAQETPLNSANDGVYLFAPFYDANYNFDDSYGDNHGIFQHYNSLENNRWGMIITVLGDGYGDDSGGSGSDGGGDVNVDLTPVLDGLALVDSSIIDVNSTLVDLDSNVFSVGDLSLDNSNKLDSVSSDINDLNLLSNDILDTVSSLDGSGFDDTGIIDSVVGLGDSFLELVEGYFGGVDSIMLSDTESMFNESDDLIDGYFTEQDGLISSAISDHNDFNTNITNSIFDDALGLIPTSGGCESLNLDFSSVGINVLITCEMTQNMRDILGFFMYLFTVFYLIEIIFTTRSTN